MIEAILFCIVPDDARVLKCLSAKRESKSIEFKEQFSPSEAAESLELLKDIVAIANSGGGTIAIGVTNSGEPSGLDVSSVLNYDHAKYCDLVQKYTLQHFVDFEVVDAIKDGMAVAIFVINPPDFPLIFQKPGQYPVENGKQKTAFGQGTIFFRHGAKSEHGTTEDLRKFMQQRMREMQEEISKGLRKVTESPRGSRIEVIPSISAKGDDVRAMPFRLVKDPRAPGAVAIDRGKICHYRQKEVIAELKRRLPNGPIPTTHDLTAINRIYDIPANEQYCWVPDFSSKQYSDAFIDWLVQEIMDDDNFLPDARAKLWSIQHPKEIGLFQ